MARVLWRDAQGKEGTVILTRLEVRIGRAADCEICTEDGMVSRYHARIVRKGAGYVVEDLGSANGIFFDERQVNSHHLSHGDAVRCGSLWIRFVEGEGAREPAAKSPPARGVRGTMVLAPPQGSAARRVDAVVRTLVGLSARNSARAVAPRRGITITRPRCAGYWRRGRARDTVAAPPGGTAAARIAQSKGKQNERRTGPEPGGP
ncbi:MAG: FHA domain-containing protein [Myxococcales bacterium]|nr:FHA domain-containing protein [Myxococcales bacterium]